MKTQKTILTISTLCLALLLTACSGKKNTETDNTQNTTAAPDMEQSQDASGVTLDDLYQQENQIFADHADAWNKAFGMVNKSTADPSGNYADFLSDTVESNKDSFTEDEYKTLTDDIETIRKIEEQIAEMENKNMSSGTSEQTNDSGEESPFKNFSGTDFDGNSVDESLFSGNAVTVVNFWFTGCKPCVA